mgnify:CR=1 FL=1
MGKGTEEGKQGAVGEEEEIMKNKLQSPRRMLNKKQKQQKKMSKKREF